MNDDVIWFLDVINMQWQFLQTRLERTRMSKQDMDRYIYSAWAITESLRAISDYPTTVTQEVILDLLDTQMRLYLSWISPADRYNKWTYCADMIQELINLLGVMKQC